MFGRLIPGTSFHPWLPGTKWERQEINVDCRSFGYVRFGRIRKSSGDDQMSACVSGKLITEHMECYSDSREKLVSEKHYQQIDARGKE
jgi:hypothetical protein